MIFCFPINLPSRNPRGFVFRFNFYCGRCLKRDEKNLGGLALDGLFGDVGRRQEHDIHTDLGQSAGVRSPATTPALGHSGRILPRFEGAGVGYAVPICRGDGESATLSCTFQLEVSMITIPIFAGDSTIVSYGDFSPEEVAPISTRPQSSHEGEFHLSLLRWWLP